MNTMVQLSTIRLPTSQCWCYSPHVKEPRSSLEKILVSTCFSLAGQSLMAPLPFATYHPILSSSNPANPDADNERCSALGIRYSVPDIQQYSGMEIGFLI